jgi:hypothetical protein
MARLWQRKGDGVEPWMERERERETEREREREGRERREEAVAWREEVGGDGLKGGSRLSPDLA